MEFLFSFLIGFFIGFSLCYLFIRHCKKGYEKTRLELKQKLENP